MQLSKNKVHALKSLKNLPKKKRAVKESSLEAGI
jgi:hypothetical protein